MNKNRKKSHQRGVRRSIERRRPRAETKLAGEGVLHLSTHGYGFVKLSEKSDEPEVFIPARDVGEGLDGDTVKVEYSPRTEEDPRGAVGRVTGVVNRARTELVGELLSNGKVRPMSRKAPSDIRLAGSRKGARDGDWVKIKLLPKSEKSHDRYLGSVTELIGEAGIVKADLDAVAAEYHLMPPYSEAENAEAEALSPLPIDRRDLTSMPTVTIDPTDAKDYDDAIGLQSGSNPNEIIIGVHIADVAAYVPPNSKLDGAAYSRGFTAYLPGRTLPMLPKGLTAKISLREGVESCAHTVLFTVNRESGEVLKTERVHSTIKVQKRLNYREVQTFFDTRVPPPEWSEELSQTVLTLLSVARIWRERRAKVEQYIDLAIPEVRVLCDEEKNRILGISSKVQRESEQLVEEYMLAANSVVAAEVSGKHLPALFRIHDEPDPEKLAEFTAVAQESFHIATGDLSNRANCIKFIASLPDNEFKPIILSSLLRSMPRAMYSADPALHYGLGKTLYSHFTSPIRRYTDLALHQQLWKSDRNEKFRDKNTMQQIAETCSALEENNDNAYFAANDRLKLRYLAEKLGKDHGKVYTGIVRKVTSAGVLAEITELGLYGFVPIRARRRFGSPGTRGAEPLEVGDLLHLQLTDIDFSRQSAIFGLA